MSWFVSFTDRPVRPRHDPAWARAAVTELMGELMAEFDELPRVRRGPIHSLYAALRRRAPQVSVTRPDADGGPGLRVAYRGQTAHVIWDDDLKLYAWDAEAAGQIGADVEKAVEMIAWTLGAPSGGPNLP
ncbi:hypothetical protein [Actinomadura sp. 9N215]|uniref:hypothetical protein n=1 Tax=Actinomadura sp. 9N215 TaxID=3375150 RepID=UPI0037951F09